MKVLDAFSVSLPVGFDKVEKVRAGVFRRDAFPLDPLKILARDTPLALKGGGFSGTSSGAHPALPSDVLGVR